MQKPFYIDDIARKIREVLAERVSPLRNLDRLP
jgi:hypothetical protein